MAGFLPINAREMRALGWERPDFVYVLGDAYVDHPSFGHAIISRVLERAGYRVAMLPQPDWRDPSSVLEYGEPRLGFLVTGGNMDSMVNHYSVGRHRRRNHSCLYARRRDGQAAGLCDGRLLQPHPPQLSEDPNPHRRYRGQPAPPSTL